MADEGNEKQAFLLSKKDLNRLKAMLRDYESRRRGGSSFTEDESFSENDCVMVKITGQHPDSPTGTGEQRMFVGEIVESGWQTSMNWGFIGEISIIVLGIPFNAKAATGKVTLAYPSWLEWDNANGNTVTETVYYALPPDEAMTVVTNDDMTSNDTFYQVEYVDASGNKNGETAQAKRPYDTLINSGTYGTLVRDSNGDEVFDPLVTLNGIWEATADASSGTITAKRVNADGSLASPEKTFDVLPS